MIKISANSIEECLLKASQELNCSCIDLEYEIIQQPSKGFLGIGKKEAQIVANLKSKSQKIKTSNKITPESLHHICIEVNELFALLPFELEKIEVSQYDQNTILFTFKGEDSALLIGEKGYRYKAISYLLFNWINTQYNLNIRLEIESFLASQEAMIANHLAPMIEIIKQSKDTYTTKPFDGILAYIALKELRKHLPDRYITIKTNETNETYIVVESPQNINNQIDNKDE